MQGADLLILDEPTSVLTPLEIEDLFGTLRKMKAEGHGCSLYPTSWMK
jgi:general nucleoside transport system ATP-binding protein